MRYWYGSSIPCKVSVWWLLTTLYYVTMCDRHYGTGVLPLQVWAYALRNVCQTWYYFNIVLQVILRNEYLLYIIHVMKQGSRNIAVLFIVHNTWESKGQRNPRLEWMHITPEIRRKRLVFSAYRRGVQGSTHQLMNRNSISCKVSVWWLLTTLCDHVWHYGTCVLGGGSLCRRGLMDYTNECQTWYHLQYISTGHFA